MGGEDREDVELGAEPLGGAPRPPHDALRGGLRGDERQQALADRLRRALRRQPVLARTEHLAQPLVLDVLGDLAQRDLAQRLEVLDAEEPVQRRGDAGGRVDLARAQALDQRRRRDVDEHDLVGRRQHAVGQRLAHAHARELRDLVVERLEVLHVDGGVHVDPGGEHVVDVLVALAVLDARRVRVRELVDQAQLGLAREQPREVELLERDVAVRHAPAAESRQALGLRLGLLARVRLEVADHDVAPRLILRSQLLQRAIRLADAGRHAEEDLVMADHAPSRLWTTRSISLMPMNGAIRPPTP